MKKESNRTLKAHKFSTTKFKQFAIGKMLDEYF